MMSSIALVAAMFIADASPSLVVYKSLAPHIVADQKTTVSITVQNVGDAPAHNVEVEDSTWVNAAGSYKHKWSKIAAGSTVTATHDIIPGSDGSIESKPAEVTYSVDTVGKTIRAAFSNDIHELATSDNKKAPKNVPIISQTEYNRKTSRHAKEWFTFLLLLLVTLGLPFYFSKQSSNNLAAKRTKLTEAFVAAEKAKAGKSSSPVRK